jgi:outer membrane cobalamin receptor
MTYIKQYYLLLSFLFWSSTGSYLKAQEVVVDTIPTHALQEVEVQAASLSSYRSSSPAQLLRTDAPEKLNALSVSDAVKHFSGVQVKDYGGVGGLKTVSIRSLGANYTTVAYDGVTLSDYQTGQIDLGRFSLNNVETVGLNVGESDDIFQPARNRALGSIIQIVTPAFQFSEKLENEFKSALKAGSFGMINPSLFISRKLNRTLTANLSGEYLKTEGNYPFTIHYGITDSISNEKRINSDVENWKLETNLAGRFPNGGKLRFKTYAFISDRGVPGSVIYHNRNSGERVNDQNVFSQITYTQSLNSRLDIQTHSKFNYACMDYHRDSLQNRYYQREYYLTVTFRYRMSDALSFSWANDGSAGSFSSFFNQPLLSVSASRINWMSAISGKYETKNLTLTSSLFSNYVFESATVGDIHPNSNHFSPYIGLSVQPFRQIPLRWRIFYKNTYRLPTFGDRYFSSAPNPDLKAENAHQYNGGLTWIHSLGEWMPYISLSADAYYNRIANKIVALPRGSMVIWSVLNYGEAVIKGIDLNMNIHLSVTKEISATINGNYTYQDVRDKTTGSTYYNKHLPYTPHHIGNGSVSLKLPWLELNYHVLYSGVRYINQSAQLPARLKSYMEQGIAFTKRVQGKYGVWDFSFECLNLWDEAYEVVKDYPMPGRNYRLGIKFSY